MTSKLRALVRPTGETLDGREVFVVTPCCGNVMVGLIEAYRRKNEPLRTDECKAVVRGKSPLGDTLRNPFATLSVLESAGLLKNDQVVRNRMRVPRLDIRLVLADGTVLWPKAETPSDVRPDVPVIVPEPEPEPESEPKPEKKMRRSHCNYSVSETLDFLRVNFGQDPFTAMDASKALSMKSGTFYDRLRPLLLSGDIEKAGGIKGKRGDPQQYRVRAESPATSEEAPEEVEGDGSPIEEPSGIPAPVVIRTKEELCDDCDGISRELVRLRELLKRKNELVLAIETQEIELANLLTLMRDREEDIAKSKATLEGMGPVDPTQITRLDGELSRLHEIISAYEGFVLLLTRPTSSSTT